MSIKRKYRINELLESLSVRKNAVALKILPSILNVSTNTFYNYRSISADSPQDIPYEKVEMLERFFCIKPGELKNYEPVYVRPISEINDEGEVITPATFGLSK